MDEGAVIPGTLTLIGSGELASSMSKVHRAVAARLGGAVRPTVIDTPAGFEPNCADIAAKAVTYLERHLGSKCTVTSYHLTDTGDDAPLQRALATLQRANYIFAGPGSPTYAIRCWRYSPAMDAIRQRLAEGAHLVFASAAAIACGVYSLPVYEIFKAGADPHWVEGTDLLAPYGCRVVVVPHWNNAEGGTYDTSCCFMGRARFERLESLLDPDAIVLAIDEHTACTIDLAAGECLVTGAGHVTIRRSGHESAYESGTAFPFDLLRSSAAARLAELRPPVAATSTGDRREQLVREVSTARELLAAGDGLAAAAGSAFALATAVDSAISAGVDRMATDAAHDVLVELVTAWGRDLTRESSDAAADIRPFVDLLVSVRTSLREQNAWSMADAVRDGLAELGIVLEDTPGATTWKRV